MAPIQARSRGAVSGPSQQRSTSRNTRIHMAVWVVIVFVSVVGPTYFLTKRAGSFLTGPSNLLLDGSPDEFQVEERRRRMATMEMGDSQLDRGKAHLAKSPLEVEGAAVKVNATFSDGDGVTPYVSKTLLEGATCEDDNSCGDNTESQIDATRTDEPKLGPEGVGKGAVWQRGLRPAHSDHNVRIMRDQLVMARAFTSMDGIPGNSRLVKDLKSRLKENTKAVEDVSFDSDLPRGSKEKMEAMARLLAKVAALRYTDKVLIKRLKSMLEATEHQLRSQKKQSNFLNQLAAKSVPKGLHCLSMRLTVDYNALPLEQQVLPESPKLEDNSLYHYAIFSDNVLAVSVVVNSTVINAQDPEKHVFHIVTDTLNYGAMLMWFHANPPFPATLHVQNVDTFRWLNSSYCPVLQQLETDAMKRYFFFVKASGKGRGSSSSTNLKYRNPKYLSLLNHLRFYLPEVFPALDKVLFLDDDVVVRKDLTPLWEVDLQGKVNGAVETCGKAFHRFDRYLNFSNALIRQSFSPRECGWAYGMNVFDLREWKRRNITGIYHKWQNLNSDRTLWKLGTLPPGLITFHKLIHPLAKSWHVLGLGYNPDTSIKAIESAAVVHYNGNLKPWLDIGIPAFKPYWSKYVKYDHPWLQQCNFASD